MSDEYVSNRPVCHLFFVTSTFWPDHGGTHLLRFGAVGCSDVALQLNPGPKTDARKRVASFRDLSAARQPHFGEELCETHQTKHAVPVLWSRLLRHRRA